MSFTLFTEPKMERVARELVSSLEELCRQKWSKYLVLVGNNKEDVGSPMHLNWNPKEILELPRFNRPKEHFSWDLTPFTYGNIDSAKEDAKNEYYYYAQILNHANDICTYAENYNFELVLDRAKRIKEASYLFDNDRSEGKLGYTTGGNIVVDIFAGIAGIVHALVMLLVGALHAHSFYLEESKYCGGSQFFIDTFAYLAESTLKVVGSLCPPLGMLYSKVYTDSFNTLTKGKVERAVDGLESMANEEITKAEHDSYLKAIDKSDNTMGY